MRVIATLLLLTFAAVPAVAHGPVPVQPDALWRSWSFDPLVILPLLLSQWLYGRGVLRLWARAGWGRGVTYLQLLSFALGQTVLIVALVSPVDPLGETLLSAHMAQHALLVTVAPPLLLLGKPGVAFAWALPASRRRNFLLSTGWRRLAGLGEALSRPLPAAALHGLTLWFWHAPAAFDAAVTSYGVHALEHVSFFGTALLFWRAVLNARSSQRAGRALGGAFATLMHGGLLGALITMAPYPLYGAYLDHAELWGLSPLEDQQLAGLLMWVPMGVIYLGACLLLAGRLVGLEAEPVGSSQVKTIPVKGGRP
jgi:putative membrane protein